MNNYEFAQFTLLELEIETTESFLRSLKEIVNDPNEKRADKARARWLTQREKKALKGLKAKYAVMLKEHGE